MSDAESQKVFKSLARQGFTNTELFVKTGRSRRLEWHTSGELVSSAEETGWAVRAGDSRSSVFVTGSGKPSPGFPWPSGDGKGLELPEPSCVPSAPPEDGVDTPLMIETRSRDFLRSLKSELVKEIPDGRLLRAVVEDGHSRSKVTSSKGVAAEVENRIGWLHLEVDRTEADGRPFVFELAARSASDFSPQAIARQLVDRLLVERAGTAPARDEGQYLLAPTVGAQLLAGLVPALVGPRAVELANHLKVGGEAFASRAVSIIDDGQVRGGLLSAPVDGEGVATRETVLVERGKFRQPLLSWRDGRSLGETSGCMRRPSYRDLPARAPSHLFFRPKESASVGSLLQRIGQGYYLLAATSPARFDFEADGFEIGVCGFVIESGRATRPLAGARLRGRASHLLQGIEAVARDLVFFPLGSLVGSPSMLVSGVELVRG